MKLEDQDSKKPSDIHFKFGSEIVLIPTLEVYTNASAIQVEWLGYKSPWMRKEDNQKDSHET